MGYYFELRPKHVEGTLSIETYKQRFFDAGLHPHPARSDPNEENAIKDKYADDIECLVGIITVQADKDNCITAYVRATPTNTAVNELLKIAAQVDADLYSQKGYLIQEGISPDGIDPLVVKP